MTMRGEEAAAVLPEPRPDAFAVGLRKVQAAQRDAREELEAAFAHGRRDLFELWFQFKQEHQPVRVALVTVFTHKPGEVEVRG